MLTTYEEIRQQLLDEWQHISDTADMEDIATQYADGVTPIYYSDIISEWQKLPSEYCDEWQQIGASADSTITNLMQMDLYLYYLELCRKALDEITEEKQAA